MAELRQAIQQLEVERSDAREAIREHMSLLHGRFAPENILKSTLNNTVLAGILNSNFIRTSATLLIGNISKLVLIGSSPGWFRKSLGSVLSVSLANIITRNPIILNTVEGWLSKLTHYVVSKSDHASEVVDSEKDATPVT